MLTMVRVRFIRFESVENEQPLETATCIAGKAGLSGFVEETCNAGDLCGRQLLSRTAS